MRRRRTPAAIQSPDSRVCRYFTSAPASPLEGGSGSAVPCAPLQLDGGDPTPSADLFSHALRWPRGAPRGSEVGWWSGGSTCLAGPACRLLPRHFLLLWPRASWPVSTSITWILNQVAVTKPLPGARRTEGTMILFSLDCGPREVGITLPFSRWGCGGPGR